SVKRLLIALSVSLVGIAAGSTHHARADAGTTGNAQVHQDRPQIMMRIKAAKPRGGGSNLSYHGGTGGFGVETGADKVYLIYWGSQWTSNDPSGEASIQQNFFNHVGGSSWNNSVTQYCQGVASGTITCGSSGTHAVNPSGVLGGVWFDNASAAPSKPSQTQLGNEAINAASHFGNT